MADIGGCLTQITELQDRLAAALSGVDVASDAVEREEEAALTAEFSGLLDVLYDWRLTLHKALRVLETPCYPRVVDTLDAQIKLLELALQKHQDEN